VSQCQHEQHFCMMVKIRLPRLGFPKGEKKDKWDQHTNRTPHVSQNN